MASTLTNYQLIARDLGASLKRKAADPVIARDTAYFQANIGKVKSIDDFMKDTRLYTYAMKAYGLEEMTYAKALMRKVLTEGSASPASFANRLADARYVAFARAFDFATGASATGADKTITATSEANAGLLAGTPAQLNGGVVLPETFDFSGTAEVRFSISSRLDASTTKSVTIVLNKASLAPSAEVISRVSPTELVAAINAQIEASGEAGLKGLVQVGIGVSGRLFMETRGFTGTEIVTADTVISPYPAGGTIRTLAVRNLPLSGQDQTALDIGFGTGLAPDAKAKAVTDAYLRQTLETDAGVEDTGVRLALYFARQASGLKSAYDILGDPALSQVANTVIGLPATSGAATQESLARRAALISAKIDVASFRDPAKVEAFVRRFAAIWDAQNNAGDSPVTALFSGGGSDAALLLGLQRSRARL
ncbi:DUF1217 domain-containing protein [Methylobacterium oryzisoli]|uniref:DUF1217 domain-containing protein n=1 Tax=Methylobacterium oryzisoli TaxID=3385502 RepID=UPI003892AA2B